ncbi:protein lsm12 homolog a [Phtheirospermum japonicum]|uniref:Protein lsm12 homolog a n=1 Tax=Phtheirospermum japonicum TaxID=374723 RepID=A0A830CBC9_9LAMI|nr:protein lsm12 homolog a [Phtheirospermum japonicum]
MQREPWTLKHKTKNLQWAAFYQSRPHSAKNFKPKLSPLTAHQIYGKLQEGVKSGAGPKRNIRLLKANYIKEFTFLGQGEDPLDANKCFLDLNTLQSREESAIRQAEADAERIGVGVTAEAQRLFDALSKTLPVRWDKTTIIVMNDVRVGSPYLPESVIGGTPAANERVRKVLEFEKKRLQSRTLG